MKTKLFKSAFLILCVIGLLNMIGTGLYLYDTVWWYDIVLHILSGFLVAITVFIIFNFFKPLAVTPRRKVIFVAIISVFIVGVLWELYELYFRMTFLSDGVVYVFDTTKDIIDDMLGGFIGALYSIKILKNNG
jgi:hypothetical protein